MSVAQQQAEILLENVLFESPTQAAANAASWTLKASTTADLAALMADSPEGAIAGRVVGYYLAALGRAPSAAEVRYYVGVAEQGLTQAQIAVGQVAGATWDTIAAYFTQSPEFTARAGLDMSLGEIPALFEAVPWLYQSVLGRAPSGAELSYYDSQIGAGGGLNTLFREFTASPEFAADTSSQIAAALAFYGTAVASGQDPATIGGTVTLGPPRPVAPPPSPPPTPDYGVFTTGTDTLSTADGSHVYTATLGGPSATLTANDSLHGNGNTLEITDISSPTSQDLLPSGVSLTDVAAITLATAGNAGTDASHPFDLSGVTDLTRVTLVSSGSQGDFLTVGNIVAFTMQSASATVSVTGGFASLALTDNHLTTLDLSGTAGAITLTDSSGPLTLTINVDGLSQSGAIADTSNHVTALTIAGSGSSSYIGYAIAGSTLADSALTSLTVTGDVTLGNPVHQLQLPNSLAHFDSTGDTGSWVYLSYSGSGATFSFGNNESYLLGTSGNTVTAGDGTDLIFADGTGSGESITLGNGNNHVGLNDAGTDIVTLGSGANTIAISASYGTSNGDSITAGGGANTVTLNSGAGDVSVTLGTGDNTVTDNGLGGNNFTFGTGNNTINMFHAANETVTIGPDAAYNGTSDTPNLVINFPGSNTRITVANITAFTSLLDPTTTGSSPSDEISILEAALTAAHTANNFAGGVYGGNTYIVASASGTTLGPADTTIIEYTGVSLLLGFSGNTILLS